MIFFCKEKEKKKRKKEKNYLLAALKIALYFYASETTLLSHDNSKF